MEHSTRITDTVTTRISTEAASITTTLVPPIHRDTFLSHHFDLHAKLFERRLHAEMKTLCPDFESGYWNYINLSNGGCYLVPTTQPSYRIKFRFTRTPEEFDADTTGILATLFTLRSLHRQFPHLERYSNRRRWLMAYASEIPVTQLMIHH